MDFKIEYEIDPGPITEARLLSCEDIQCLGKKEFTGYFNCWNSSRCGSYVLPNKGGYSEYQRLVISFEDKQRESNVFMRKEFRATYLVNVRGDDLQVKEILTRTILDCLAAVAVFIFNLLVEIPVADLVFRRFTIQRSITWIIVANAVSLFTFVFIVETLLWHTDVKFAFNSYILVLEMYAFFLEALIIYLGNRKKGLTFNKAMTMSVVTNISSFLFGLLLYGFGLLVF